MSISNIPTIQNHVSLQSRGVERINRVGNQINANNRQINALENQIASQKEVSAVTRKLIASNSESIALTKETITATKALIGAKKEMIANNEAIISSGNRKIGILEELKASSDRLIGTHKEQRGRMVEARDLSIGARDAAVKVVDATNKLLHTHQESRDLLQESRDLLQKMIAIGEKMEAIMMKNPAKYENMTWAEFKNRSEIKEVKQDVMDKIVAPQITLYPKEAHDVLNTCANNVVDATFSEIKTDIKANREILINLPKRIEAVLDKKHESLSVKDIKQIITDHYKSVEQFSRIKKLDYLDLALKNIKV